MFPASGLCFPVSSGTMSVLFLWRCLSMSFYTSLVGHSNSYVEVSVASSSGYLLPKCKLLISCECLPLQLGGHLLFKDHQQYHAATYNTQTPRPQLKIPMSRSFMQWEQWESWSHKDPTSECHFVLSLLGTMASPPSPTGHNCLLIQWDKDLVL